MLPHVVQHLAYACVCSVCSMSTCVMFLCSFVRRGSGQIRQPGCRCAVGKDSCITCAAVMMHTHIVGHTVVPRLHLSAVDT